MDPVIVVGAGIAGVACARTLVDAGLPVVVLDRGRRIGGRMATRRLGDRPVDLGASYFTTSDDRFAAIAERWHDQGLARPWTNSFHVLAADVEPSLKTGPMRWGTPGGLRTLVEDLSTGLDVRHRTVQRVAPSGSRLLVDGAHASAVVLAMPDTQAVRLLADDAPEQADLDRGSDPVLALAATYADREWARTVDPLFEGAFVNGDDVLDFVADDGRRRGDDAPMLVAHSTSAFAARHLEAPEARGRSSRDDRGARAGAFARRGTPPDPRAPVVPRQADRALAHRVLPAQRPHDRRLWRRLGRAVEGRGRVVVRHRAGQ